MNNKPMVAGTKTISPPKSRLKKKFIKEGVIGLKVLKFSSA